MTAKYIGVITECPKCQKRGRLYEETEVKSSILHRDGKTVKQCHTRKKVKLSKILWNP